MAERPSRGPVDRPFFLPAETAGEAITRIYSLTGAADAGTRGEKRAVVALRDALGVDVDTGATSDVMGAAIAEVLGVPWVPALYLEKHKLTLGGLNALLEGATDAYHDGSLRQLEAMRPDLLSGPEWAAFNPARSKIEAVNRISLLTDSGPEYLGPGGKEHKRVLINLVNGMGLHIPITTKHGTAAALAREFGAPWADSCVSTQGTITLSGLNVLLAGAERRLGKLGVARAALFGTPEQEGAALAAALLTGWRPTRQADGSSRVVWDARQCVQWMKRQGITKGPNENEWQGFYFEHRGVEILNAAFTPITNPPRSRYENTSFDYSLRYVWDLKAHTESQILPVSGKSKPGLPGAPLNDQLAMRACIEDQGLGFLMLGGRAVMDEDRAFYQWHRTFKGREPAPSNTGRSTMRKAAFEPLHVEAFWFANIEALDAAYASGLIKDFSQGRQSRGATRKLKYELNARKARAAGLSVARHDWPHD
ncbi:hypothetical protein OMK64_09980 [Cellulomonas fimi]|uniref:hypothetical protein n=1 Tax=Cellulomonas fimi TaxID=1708 RepID=UPI00234CAEF7|nr:hypothetical protein [Cellulomonas fimi]MDC7121863.1 hypothetical protein [Cellulomonas fimi]